MQKILPVIFVFFLSLHHVFGQSPDSNLIITPLTGDFYVFTTFNEYKGARIPANGLYAVTNDGVVLIDTPWDTTQFQPLLDRIKARHGKNVVMAIATHFHEDRTGGLAYYRQQGIRTYTTRQTDELCKKEGMKRAEFLIDRDTVFQVGQYSFQTYYPGHGHAPDNIVVWFEQEKILYGGCLIKSVEDENLGNLGDASVKDYATTVRNVQKKCRNPRFVIPGHNAWKSVKSVKHTLKMARRLAHSPPKS
jgi:metallo-beta-lactamase class B